MAMLYSLGYLVVGLAIALWAVMAPGVRGRMANLRSIALSLFILAAIVYNGGHRFPNDPYVVLGFVAITLSWAYLYLRNNLAGLACVYVAISLAWSICAALTLTHRANEPVLSWLAIFGLVAWAAGIVIYARVLRYSGDPLGIYDRHRQPEDWITWDLKKSNARD
jgi:hypothetical protein